MTAVKVPSQRAATTGAVRSLRSEAPDLDTAARRLTFSAVNAIRRAHGERDPGLVAGSDEDNRFEGDPDEDPGDWQDQELYDAMLFGIVNTSARSSPDGYYTASPCSSQNGSVCRSYLGAVSDEDARFEDDPGDWQDQELYEDAMVSDCASAPRDDSSCCSDPDDYGDAMSDYSGHYSYGDY